MPRKEIVRTCKNIGKQLAKECDNGGSVNVKRVSEILTERIGSKKAGKIIIADDFDTFKRYAGNIGLNDDMAKMYFEASKSAVLPNPKDKSILLSLRLGGMNTAEALNTASHELEHTLFKTLSPRAFLEKLYLKLRGQKYVDKLTQKYGNLINEKNMDLQQGLLYHSKLGESALQGSTMHELNKKGLLAQMELPNEKSFQNVINGLVEYCKVENNPKVGLNVMKGLRGLLKDESRAYKVGGAVQRFWDESKGMATNNANKSEMFAMLYDETLKVVKKEIKNLRKQRIKSFFDIKLKSAKPLMTTNPDGSMTVEISGKKFRVVEKEISEADIPDNLKGFI